jgi:hypothetical protein
MSQFVVFNRGDEKLILFTKNIVVITQDENQIVTVFAKGENSIDLTVDNTFEDIINQLKCQ